MKRLSIILCLLIWCACSHKPAQAPLFEQLEHTGIDFVNKVQDNDSINILNYRNFYNGGGVAVGDINNDGLPDVFFTANQGPNKLYLNKGNFHFDDISEKAGFADKRQFSTGVVMVDVNHDGWLDIFVSNAGNMEHPDLRRNQLFINNHNNTFTESAEKYGLASDGYTTQVSFFDYDGDGDLDCFMIDNSPIPVNSLNYPQQRDVLAKDWIVPDYLKGGGDHLYRNDNDHFTEVTKEAGIHGTLMSFGLGVTVGDINGDGWPDVYVSNDFFERDYLYINQKNGTFKDELEDRLRHISYASMGADIADINNDGYPEIFTTDMLPADDYRLKTTLSFDDIDLYRLKEKTGFFHQFLQNTLQFNNQHGQFLDIANYSGVSASEWSWGALMFDADNDGWNDIYISNGINRDLTNQDFLEFDASQIKDEMIATGKKDLSMLVNRIPSIAVPNKMFHNLGNLRFDDIGERWGLTQNSFSNGAAYADLDGDGDLDLVVNNVNQPAFVYRNNARELNHNNYLAVSLKGTSPNTFAIGAKVQLFVNHQVQTREVIPSRGFQSSVDYKQLFGLGKENHIDSLVITWPNRTQTTINNPAINKTLSLSQTTLNPSTPQPLNPPAAPQPYFTQVPAPFDKHTENPYIDFYQERGIPEMLSCEGPKAATADVNGDGLMDIYIGGTSAQPGQLYIQAADGSFTKKNESFFKQFQGFEDGAMVFFDADGDGDMDLFLGAGGNEALPASRELQHRLLLNDGKGNFSLAPAAFPVNEDNIAAAVAYDFNHDGYLDLFVGGRSVSKEYGLTPHSHVYINNGKGQFTSLAPDKMAGLEQAGMITGAVMARLDNSSDKDLVVVGEWMSPRAFRFANGGFEEIKTSLAGKKGWWQTVAVADLNGDGREDLVLGNFGENFYLHPDAAHPVKLWMKDFDRNGRIDKVVSRTVDGKDKPVFMKHETEDGMPILKKQNLRNADFASKSVQELFSPDQLQDAEVKEVNTTASCIAFNMGNGQFAVQDFPLMVQLSSVRAVAVTDVNADGKPDLVLGGNEFNFQPQLGRLDASMGNLLINNGQGHFNMVDPLVSGLQLRGMVRDIVTMPTRGKQRLLVLQNNEKPQSYEVARPLAVRALASRPAGKKQNEE